MFSSNYYLTLIIVFNINHLFAISGYIYFYVIAIIQFRLADKEFQVLLFNTNNSIHHYSFVCTELNDSKYHYVLLTIQLNISYFFTLS